jgi:hypothetical protein
MPLVFSDTVILHLLWAANRGRKPAFRPDSLESESAG